MPTTKKKKTQGGLLEPSRPFTKPDFEAVVKAATRPLPKKEAAQESEGPSVTHRPDGSTGKRKR